MVPAHLVVHDSDNGGSGGGVGEQPSSASDTAPPPSAPPQRSPADPPAGDLCTSAAAAPAAQQQPPSSPPAAAAAAAAAAANNGATTPSGLSDDTSWQQVGSSSVALSGGGSSANDDTEAAGDTQAAAADAPLLHHRGAKPAAAGITRQSEPAPLERPPTAAAKGTPTASAAPAKPAPRPLRRALALQATFLFSGLWHMFIWQHHHVGGAGWRWLAFFSLQAPIIVAEAALQRLWLRGRGLPPLPGWVSVPLTNFLLLVIAGAFLRACLRAVCGVVGFGFVAGVEGGVCLLSC